MSSFLCVRQGYVAQSGLEFTTQPRLASHSQKSSFFSPLSGGLRIVHHMAWCYEALYRKMSLLREAINCLHDNLTEQRKQLCVFTHSLGQHKEPNEAFVGLHKIPDAH